jgi:hypothetical protein
MVPAFSDSVEKDAAYAGHRTISAVIAILFEFVIIASLDYALKRKAAQAEQNSLHEKGARMKNTRLRHVFSHQH